MSSSTELFGIAQFLALFGAHASVQCQRGHIRDGHLTAKKNRPAFWDLMPKAWVSIGTATTRQHHNYVQWDHYFSWMCTRTVGPTSQSPIAPDTLFIKNCTDFQLLYIKKKKNRCSCWMISEYAVLVSGLKPVLDCCDFLAGFYTRLGFCFVLCVGLYNEDPLMVNPWLKITITLCLRHQSPWPGLSRFEFILGFLTLTQCQNYTDRVKKIYIQHT